MNLQIGPQVAIIDDKYDEIKPLESVFKDLHIGTQFFNAQLDEVVYPDSPIESIQLILLDLYYKHDFDPEICAQWIRSIIAKNQKYNLLIWSKDTDEVDKLLNLLNRLDLVPNMVEVWQKTNFDLRNHDFHSQLKNLIDRISAIDQIEEQVIQGEIIEVEEDGVLVNCLINDNPPTFQVRKFDITLLSNLEKIGVGIYVKIHIFTKPGARLFNVFEEKKDNSALFQQEDFFKGLEGSSFFKEG